MMKTILLEVDRENPLKKTIQRAGRILQRGGIVAFPTETVYGLGANALSSKAVAKIFRAKKRPFDDPLIVHICDEKQAYILAQKVTMQAKMLMDKFWPGPLTIVLAKARKVPSITTGNLGTVAIRMPNHKVACQLIRAAGFPIAAPSANLFGKPSPTSAKHVLEDLDGRIDAVLDSGRTHIGIESTVVDLSGKNPVLLRPGKITAEELEKVIGKIIIHPLAKALHGKGTAQKSGALKAKSPGMHYRHYAPKARIVIVQGGKKAVRKKINELLAKNSAKKCGVLAISANKYSAFSVKRLGKSHLQAAKKLFGSLRELDSEGVEIIFAEGLEERGVGFAVMNRLRKAAEKVVRA